MLQAGDNDARHHRSCLQEGQCTLPGSCKPSGAAIVAQLLRYELILNFNWYRTNCWCSLMWIGCFLIACKFFCEIKLNMQNVTSWGSSCMPRWRWQMWPARCSKRDSVPGKLGRAWPCLVRLDDEVLMLNESQAERLPLFFLAHRFTNGLQFWQLSTSAGKRHCGFHGSSSPASPSWDEAPNLSACLAHAKELTADTSFNSRWPKLPLVQAAIAAL